MLKTFLLTAISACCSIMALAQDCTEMLQVKIEQYFLNIRPKPDSLSVINCDFIKQRLGPDDVFLDFLSTNLNNAPTFFLTIIPKTGSPKTIFIPQLKSTSVVTTETSTRSKISKTVKKDNYDKYENLLGYFEQEIKNANTIYYSTTADLNLVNIKYLKDKSNIPLFKKHNMIRLHSAASFLAGQQQLLLSTKMNTLLVGTSTTIVILLLQRQVFSITSGIICQALKLRFPRLVASSKKIILFAH